jgi:tRNA(Ile)-lysidine synthase
MTETEKPIKARPDSAVLARWRADMRQAGFFRPGDRVGVAVSGGADSVLLLEFMMALGRELGLGLAVVHFNHGLRGAESEGDERFVRERAEERGLDLLLAGAKVARVAREQKKNLEATARELRYRFFFSLVRQGKIDKVATAHTADDQAETVLLRLLRGAGTRGLGGIHPTLEGGVVRPFLGLTRAQVESEVARRGLDFRSDSSNSDTRFTRNRLRREVMPLLEREFNPQIASALSAFADQARDDEAFLETQARERSRPWIVREAGGLKIPAQRLNEFPPAVARRVVRQMLAEAPQLGYSPPSLGGEGPGVTGLNRKLAARGQSVVTGHGNRVPSYADIECIRRLAREGQSGKRLLIGGCLEVRKEFEWLVMRSPPRGVEERPDTSRSFASEIRPPAQVPIPELGLLLHFRVADKFDANFPQEGYTGGVWLDADGLRGPLILRNFHPGDCVYRLGPPRPLKVKEIFWRRRVPREQRPYWPVLESEGKVIWARGLDTPRNLRSHLGPAGGRLMVIEERSLSGWNSEHKH